MLILGDLLGLVLGFVFLVALISLNVVYSRLHTRLGPRVKAVGKILENIWFLTLTFAGLVLIDIYRNIVVDQIFGQTGTAYHLAGAWICAIIGIYFIVISNLLRPTPKSVLIFCALFGSWIYLADQNYIGFSFNDPLRYLISFGFAFFLLILFQIVEIILLRKGLRYPDKPFWEVPDKVKIYVAFPLALVLFVLTTIAIIAQLLGLTLA